MRAIVAFREPETSAEAAELDPAAALIDSPARSAGWTVALSIGD
jgi:hypothetical protein